MNRGYVNGLVTDFQGYRLHGYVAQAINDPGSHDQQVAALALAKGDYQVGIITGRESVSGSTLKGKAARYIGHYRQSRDNLFERMNQAGIRFQVLRFRGKDACGYRIDRNVLVFGDA